MDRISFCVGVLLLALSGSAKAEGLKSGLYEMNWNGPGRSVQRADTLAGDKIYLTNRLTGTFRDASLVSMSNDNSRFRLRMKAGPIARDTDWKHLALVVGDLCMPAACYSEVKANGLLSIDATVASKEAAERIAKELHIKPRLRTHPGHKLRVTVQPKWHSYRPNEPIILTMTITNVGKTTVRFMDGGKLRGQRNNQFSFIVGPRPIADTGDPIGFGGIATLKKLKPADTFSKKVILTNWFKFTETGHYEIAALYELNLVDESDYTIWEDFAVARCFLRIDKPAPSAPADTLSEQEEKRIRKLIAGLGYRSHTQSNDDSEELVHIGAPAIPLLLEALEPADESEPLAKRRHIVAVMILGIIDDPSAVEGIIKAMDRNWKDAHFLKAAISSLVQINDKRALPAIESVGQLSLDFSRYSSHPETLEENTAKGAAANLPRLQWWLEFRSFCPMPMAFLWSDAFSAIGKISPERAMKLARTKHRQSDEIDDMGAAELAHSAATQDATHIQEAITICREVSKKVKHPVFKEMLELKLEDLMRKQDK